MKPTRGRTSRLDAQQRDSFRTNGNFEDATTVNQFKRACTGMPITPSVHVVEQIGSGLVAVMARPAPGEWLKDELNAIANCGIDRVVSLLESDEAEQIGLAEEALHCKEVGMQFLSYPIADRGLPRSLPEFSAFTHMLYETIGQGIDTVVHCRAGIGRTGIVAAGVLVQAGFEPDEAFEHVSKARGMAVPDTEEQRSWVISNHRAICSTIRG